VIHDILLRDCSVLDQSWLVVPELNRRDGCLEFRQINAQRPPIENDFAAEAATEQSGGLVVLFFHVGLGPQKDGLRQRDKEDECGNQQPIDQQVKECGWESDSNLL
jgi:hypothetical protein